MSVGYREFPGAGVAEIVVDGRVTRADFDRIAPRLRAFIAAEGRVGLIEVIRRLDGFEPGMILPGARFTLANLRRFSRVAIVSDLRGLGALVAVAGRVLPGRYRAFPLARLDAARGWIGAPGG